VFRKVFAVVVVVDDDNDGDDVIIGAVSDDKEEFEGDGGTVSSPAGVVAACNCNAATVAAFG
jgi:hypothetical protein